MKLILRSILALMLAPILFFGCQSDKFQQSPDGYKVKFIKKGEGTTPQDGSYVEFNLVYKDAKDSVLIQLGRTGWANRCALQHEQLG